jgi:formylmethanofuran dehydrogenase subunit E
MGDLPQASSIPAAQNTFDRISWSQTSQVSETCEVWATQNDLRPKKDTGMLYSIEDLLEKCASRHSSLCPRQVLGVRMGLAGLGALGLEAPVTQKIALVIVETDGCFADGIEVSTGTSVGHRTLRIVDLGKVAATFTDLKSGRSIRLAPAQGVRERARIYAPEEGKAYAAQLKGYQLMPEAELFTFREVSLQPSLETILSQPDVRAQCCRCGEEIINQREVTMGDRTYCQTCFGESYYKLLV